MARESLRNYSAKRIHENLSFSRFNGPKEGGWTAQRVAAAKAELKRRAELKKRRTLHDTRPLLQRLASLR